MSAAQKRMARVNAVIAAAFEDSLRQETSGGVGGGAGVRPTKSLKLLRNSR
jgi:hypothetical protein